MFKKFLIILMFCTSIILVIPTKAQTLEEIPKATIKTDEVDFKPSSYELISPIGNMSKIADQDPAGFSGFVNLIIVIAIALAGAIAVIIIIISGIQYMGSDSVWQKGDSKTKISSAVGGIVLLLCSYIILNTINPDLVNIKIGGMKRISEGEWPLPTDAAQYRQSTNTNTSFTRTKYYNQIKQTSNLPEYSIPHCLLQVAILRESGGIDGLVGHDEEAPLNGIKSRREFVMSGKKYKGSTFSPDVNKITDRTFHNDDHAGTNLFSASNPDAQDLGLDWRYSHAVGLFGVTFYPKGEPYGDYTKGIEMKILKKTIFPKDLFDPTTDIKVAAEMMKNKHKECKGDIEGIFRAYGAGKCGARNAFTNTEAPLRKKLYDQCVSQDK